VPVPALQFQIDHRARDCAARVGRVTTPHGCFDTPAFMPVGTQATVKGLLPAQLSALGVQILLANTYHLLLRPGPDLVASQGGLQRWMNWPGPILTDSGGFQVFSLGDISRIDEDGVTFKSHLDGATIELTPQRSMQVQNALGADIIMAFDDCPPAQGAEGKCPEVQPRRAEPRAGSQLPGERGKLAVERTLRWLDRCVAAHARKDDQALFGIVQGGTDLDLRRRCAMAVAQHDLLGYAIGGVAVGEGFAGLQAVVEYTAPLLPADRPRYLMGVGYERDILVAVRAGVDMFDCVLPTRNGRNACAFTRTGVLRLRNAQYAQDPQVIEPGCDCPACAGAWVPAGNTGAAVSGFSRSYLRHLFQAGEMLGPILVSAHNLRHFQRYMLDIRRAITDNDWSLIERAWPVAGAERSD
jgi:queuine tRNA-ribosyltransferase